MNAQVQAIGKRLFYTARKSALLRRIVAMPVIAGVVNRLCRRILQPAVGYPQWIRHRLVIRRDLYACAGEPGLLSFLSTVWNTPLHLLQPAVESLLRHQTVGQFQWVILDNGSTAPAVVRYLRDVAAGDPRVIFLRVEKNLGIIGGMHLAMSRATGKYVLPFDSDDLLQPDAVAVLTHQLRAMNYPPLVYTDEDKLDGDEPCWPYFKPDWDPVLFGNSCYVAHLGCMDRVLAIELGVYTDSGCDGCHDWDAFMRFTQAGYTPAHIPEMLYSWRMHGNSTAVNTRSKSYIFDSQRNHLTRFLASSAHGDKFELVLSPLFQGTPDWWMKRKEAPAPPILPVVLASEKLALDVREILPKLTEGLVLVTLDSLKLDRPDWPLEVTGLFELYPDTVMIGGLVLDSKGRVVESGRVPGFAGVFGCPDRGRDGADPGAGAALWKQRSSSGVSTRLCVMRAEFLRQVIDEFPDQAISWSFLGAWAALSAWRHQQRIICTPFLSGVCDLDPEQWVPSEEMDRFKKLAGDFMSDRRYYNRHLSLRADQPYVPVPEIKP